MLRFPSSDGMSDEYSSLSRDGPEAIAAQDARMRHSVCVLIELGLVIVKERGLVTGNCIPGQHAWNVPGTCFTTIAYYIFTTRIYMSIYPGF
jgi:hypothetical protein